MTFHLDPSALLVCNASILCGTQVYHCLPASWSRVCELVFLFPMLGMIQKPKHTKTTQFTLAQFRGEGLTLVHSMLVNHLRNQCVPSPPQLRSFSSPQHHQPSNTTHSTITVRSLVFSLCACVMSLNKAGPSQPALFLLFPHSEAAFLYTPPQ